MQIRGLRNLKRNVWGLLSKFEKYVFECTLYKEVVLV